MPPPLFLCYTRDEDGCGDFHLFNTLAKAKVYHQDNIMGLELDPTKWIKLDGKFWTYQFTDFTFVIHEMTIEEIYE